MFSSFRERARGGDIKGTFIECRGKTVATSREERERAAPRRPGFIGEVRNSEILSEIPADSRDAKYSD